jgi:uncharacterized membrane protein
MTFSVPVSIVADPVDLAGWAQAVGGALTIFAAWIIARRDRRITAQRLNDQARDRTSALKALVAECIVTMQALDTKASGRKFTRGNVEASEADAAGLVAALASVPLLDLKPSEVPVLVNVRKHMTTAQRRVGFIQDRLKAGSSTAGIAFGSLVKQLRDEEARL